MLPQLPESNIVKRRRLPSILVLQLPGRSRSRAIVSLPGCCCNYWGKVINSQRLPLMLLLHLPGCSFINSQRLPSIQVLQLPGSSRSSAISSLPGCCCNYWGKVINSQRLPIMLLLHLPGCSFINSQRLPSIQVAPLESKGASCSKQHWLPVMLPSQLPGSLRLMIPLPSCSCSSSMAGSPCLLITLALHLQMLG